MIHIREIDHIVLRVIDLDRMLHPSPDAGPVALRNGAEGEGPSIYLTEPEGNVVELKGPPGR